MEEQLGSMIYNQREQCIVYKATKVYYYTNEINSNNETIVMLHPAFADHQIFVKQVDNFSNDYNVIAIDMLGHGNSTAKGNKPDLSDMPQIINEILDKHGLEKCHILGVSLGSLIAQAFADFYRSKISSVTVVGGYSIHKDNSHISKAQRKEMLKWFFYIVFSMKKFRNYIANVSADSTLGKELMLKGANQFNRGSLGVMQGIGKLLRRTDEVFDYPLLVICGEGDIDLAKNAAKLLGDEPNAKYIVIQDAGHCANIDNSSAFNQLYLDFIQNISQSR